jgi:hypothetical protein
MSMLDESGRDAHRIDTEFVSDRSTRGGWRRVEFPIGLSCDTLGEKFRGKGATDWGMSMRRVSGGDAVGCGPKFSLPRWSEDFYFSLGSSGNRRFWRVGFP